MSLPCMAAAASGLGLKPAEARCHLQGLRLTAVVVLAVLPVARHLVLIFLFGSGLTAYYRFTVKTLLLKLCPFGGAVTVKLSQWLKQVVQPPIPNCLL